MKLPSSLLSFVILLALACCLGASPALQQPSPEPNSQENISAVQISWQEMRAHRGTDHHPIRVANRKQGDSFRSVGLEIQVDPGGSVISVKPARGPAELFASAVAQAKTWKYTPFERDGVPVYAAFDEYISILPPEDLPKNHVPFPPVSTLAGIEMKLERTVCYGSCPAYSVKIKGDGTVIYIGQRNVVIAGEHRDHISEAAVSEILDAFRKADYFSLKDKYVRSVTDCPTYRTSLAVDNVRKSVTDYVGWEEGMPQAVSDLEETIDRVADTQKWIKGTSDTVGSLRAEGWNFKSVEASSVLARASREGSAAFVHDLCRCGSSF